MRASRSRTSSAALIGVYTLIIFASIIVSWVFSFGVRVPYSRPLNAVLDFLRDVTNPYLRIFRRLGPAVRPDRLQPDRRDPRADDRRSDARRASIRGVSAGRTVAAHRARRGGGRRRRSGHQGDRPRRRSRASSSIDLVLGIKLDQHAQHRRRLQHVLRRRADRRDHRLRRARPRCSRSSSPTCTERLVWLPTGLLLGGAAGNLIDRIRLGAVTDFIKIPHWPAFNVADIGVTFGVIVADLRAGESVK